jgi:Pyrimidine 5'-nucleotidase (UMPH-1)
MELDLMLPSDVKESHMVKWWEGNMDLFIGIKLQKEDYGNMVLNSRLLFRHGISELLDISRGNLLCDNA